MSQTTAQEPMQSIAVEQVDEDTSGGRKIRTLTGKETKESKNKIPFQVGNTPLIKLGRICPTGNVFGKAEFSNPTGSVKDRAAFWMLKEAIEKENLSLGNRELLDSSSGNTGISLAAFGASIGLGVTIVLPQNASQERKRMLKLFGPRPSILIRLKVLTARCVLPVSSQRNTRTGMSIWTSTATMLTGELTTTEQLRKYGLRRAER